MVHCFYKRNLLLVTYSTDKPELSGTLLDVPRLNIENLIINTME